MTRRRATPLPPGPAAPLQRGSSRRSRPAPTGTSAGPGTSPGGRRPGAGRPPRDGTPATVKVTVWLTQDRADRLDRIRGDATRAEALRGLLDRAVTP